MTNPGLHGPATPGSRLAGLHNLSGATFGSGPYYDPATNQWQIRQGGVKYNAELSAYNRSESSLRRWRAQKSKALTSASIATILCLGDSITQGITTTPYYLTNWPARLRRALSADGGFGVCGEPGAYNTGTTTTTYDDRWTAAAGWSRVPGGLLNQGMWQAFNTAAVLAFALPICDSVTIDWLRFGSSGTTMSYNIDGGSNTTINMNGATAIQSTTFSVTRGTHTLNINSAASGFTILVGLRWSDSVNPLDVGVYTGGAQTGATSLLLTENSGSVPGNLSFIDYIKPDLTLVCVGRNDAAPANGINAAAYKANVKTLIQRCRVTNGTDVAIVTPPPCNTQTYVYEPLTRRAMYELADSEDVMIIDLSNALGSSWNVAPYSLSGDNVHPNDAGSDVVAQIVLAAIR